MISEDSESTQAGPVNPAILQAFEPYLDVLASKLAAKLLKGRERMVSQHESDLGPRRHRDACKRRMQNGEGGAGKAGRNYLLTPEAVREELARGRGATASQPSSPRSAAPPAPASKSRARDLSDFERETLAGLRAAEGRR